MVTNHRKDKKKKFIKEQLSQIVPEGVNLKVGDTVKWENDCGVKWHHKVLGFNTTNWYNKKYEAFVHLDSDSYWMPHCAKDLTLIKKS